MVAKKISDFLAVLAVFVDTQLQVFGELGIELGVVFGIFCQPVEKLEALLDDVLANDLQDFALLKHFTGNVEWEIFRVYHALHEVEVFWNEVFTVLHDEDSSDIQLDVVLHLPILKKVEWSSSRYKEQRTKLELALDGEMLHCEMVLPVIGEGLVELSVLFVADVVWITGPNWFGFVQFLEFGVLLLNFFGLLFLAFVFLVTFFIILYVL